jgi:hypothetical protein
MLLVAELMDSETQTAGYHSRINFPVFLAVRLGLVNEWNVNRHNTH